MREKKPNLSSGVVPVRKVGAHWEYLTLRCFKYWDFPQGLVEANESPKACALREFSEETGLKTIRLLGRDLFIETEPYGKGKVARYYIGIVEDESPIELKPNPLTGIIEHHEYRWDSFERTSARLVPRLRTVITWAQENL